MNQTNFIKTPQLKAKIREKFGKSNRALRHKNIIPAILYGHGIKNIPLEIQKSDFNDIFEAAGQTTLIDLDIAEAQKHKVLIYDIQSDPLNDEIIHADFNQVKMTEKLRTNVPIVTIHEAPAVTDLEGNLILNKDTVEVECLPQDLIHEIEVDISELKTFEDRIFVKDLKIPDKIEILDDSEEVVVLVTPPRSEEELAELEEKVQEKPDEVEVEGEKPKEGAEAEEVEGGTEAPQESPAETENEKPKE